MIKDILLFVLVIFFGILLTSHIENFKKTIKEPCDNNLTDIEYLKHMIPHHQVAVDISVMMLDKTKWPKMQEVLRKLIWVQRYEIDLMKEFLNKLPNSLTNEKDMTSNYIAMVSDFTKPNKLGLTKTYCDPHFFDPEKHMEHMKHMKLDDNMYIEHMIPHHQFAVDMSKKLLKNTKNDFMIGLAYRIIRSQQEEIVLLNDMLKTEKMYRYQSNLI